MFEHAFLSQIPIFQDFSPEEMTRLLACAEEVVFPDAAPIIRESSPDSDLFVILDGRALVEIKIPHQPGESTRMKPLAVLRPGEVCGEIAFLKGVRRVARVSARGVVSALCLRGENLRQLLDDNPRLGYLFMRNLSTILAQRIIDINFLWRDEV